MLFADLPYLRFVQVTVTLLWVMDRGILSGLSISRVSPTPEGTARGGQGVRSLGKMLQTLSLGHAGRLAVCQAVLPGTPEELMSMNSTFVTSPGPV